MEAREGRDVFFYISIELHLIRRMVGRVPFKNVMHWRHIFS